MAKVKEGLWSKERIKDTIRKEILEFNQEQNN